MKNKSMFKMNYYVLILFLLITASEFCYVFKLVYERYFYQYDICFTPKQNCSSQIIKKIDGAKKSIYVMAYGFTSKEITGSLLEAKKRGVNINIILDKSNFSKKKHIPLLFTKYGIPIYIDYKPPISHNKVIIIDNNIVITGSYNFTGNANKNAENIMLIHNAHIAEIYMNNWISRHKESMHIVKYEKMKIEKKNENR